MAVSFAAITSALCDLASSRWIEEVLIIASIGITFALLQTGGASGRRPAKGRKLVRKEKEQEEEEQEGEGPSCSSRRVQTRVAPRVGGVQQWTSPEIAGVTDRRFVGYVRFYREDEGFGFIKCPETFEHFHRDVFMHRTDVGDFSVRIGARVSFSVFINRNGHAAAKNLEECPYPPLPDVGVDPSARPGASFGKSGGPQEEDSDKPPSSPAPDLPAWVGWNPSAAPFVPSKEFEVRQALNPSAASFHFHVGSGSVDVAAADRYRSWGATPTAARKQLPRLWGEWSGSEQQQASDDGTQQQAPRGRSSEDEKRGEKWWSPKVWDDGKRYQVPHGQSDEEAKRGEKWWVPKEWGDGKQYQAPRVQNSEEAKGGDKRWAPKAEVGDSAAPCGHSETHAQRGEKRWVPKEQDDGKKHQPSCSQGDQEAKGDEKKWWAPKEWDNGKQYQPSYGQSDQEAKVGKKQWVPKEWEDSTSGEKQWPPKAETNDPAVGSSGAWQWAPRRVLATEWQWVPKKVVASGAGSHGELQWAPKKAVASYNKLQWAPKKVMASDSVAQQ